MAEEPIITPPSETPPPLDSREYRQRAGLRLPLLIVLLGAALVVAIALVFGGRWVYQKLTKDDKSANVAVSPSSNNEAPAPPTYDNKPTTPPAGNTTPPAGGTTPPVSGGQTRPTSPNQLPNNGPGGVLALFVGSSLAAAALHFVFNLRKSARQQT